MKQRVLTAVLAGVLMLLLGGAAQASSSNGAGGQMMAYYDCEKFMINFTPLPPNAAKTILANGGQFNTIYVFPNCSNFLMVLDTIQGTEKEPVPRNGFNPLWRVVNVFPSPCPNDQSSLCSDNLILGSGAGLVVTDELVRCSVIGPTK